MPGKMQLYGPTCNESWLSDALEFAGVNISFQSANDVLSFPLFVRDFFLSFFLAFRAAVRRTLKLSMGTPHV